MPGNLQSPTVDRSVDGVAPRGRRIEFNVMVQVIERHDASVMSGTDGTGSASTMMALEFKGIRQSSESSDVRVCWRKRVV